MELVNEVMMTITDPAAMLGPEVSYFIPGHLLKEKEQCHFVTNLECSEIIFILVD